jgi:hypothetical protein
MAIEITPDRSESNPFVEDLSAIETALAQARAELGAMTDAASAADQLLDDSAEEYSLHEVPGIGRYAVIRRTGWQPLLKVIHTREANIDFSSNMYPGFDAIIGEQFDSPSLFDPLSDNYESFDNLRDNIAAVRNFLMESYYVNTPNGMTPEKAQQSLEEIATFVGQGLDNNYRFLGLIPNHDPKKPYISISEACAPGGAGAQYLYEKILEMHRHSNWMRPFSAVVALFGGKPAPDWMLPAAHETEFMDVFSKDIVHGKQATGPTPDQINAGIDRVQALEAARAELIDRHTINAAAQDLDAMSNALLASAGNMQHISSLTEPVRRDAIEIAKDILRKLMVNLGNINILDGLKLPPTDDMAALGAMKGVVMVYERLLAYSRGFNANIMQDPSILAATRAIGQMGYLAKLEALRMARIAGNSKLAESLSGQLARIPEVYATATDATFGGLLNKIDHGIDTIINRTQTVSLSGAHVGFTPGKELGSSVSTAPTAGMAQQMVITQNNVAKRNAELLAAENANLQAQANRVQAPPPTPPQTRSDVRTPPAASVPTRATTRPTPSRPTTTRPTTSGTSITGPNTTPAQQTARNNALANHAREEQEEHERQVRQQQLMEAQRREAAKKAAAQAAVKKIDPNMLKGFQNATSAKGLSGPALNPDPTAKNMYGKRIIEKGTPVAPAPIKPITTKPPEVAADGTTIDEKNKMVPPQPIKPPAGYSR